MNCNLVFDIETIPQQTSFTESQLQQFRKVITRHYKGKTSLEDLALMSKDKLPKNDDFELYRAASRKAAALDPYLGQIVCIGLMAVEEKAFGDDASRIQKFALAGEDEEKILKDFWDFLNQDMRFRYISYNGLDFDVPYIVRRSMKYGIRPTKDSFLYTKRYQRWPHFDAMKILADWDRGAQVSMALACETYGIPSPKDGEIKADGVEEAFKQGKIKQISDYCLRDLDATYKLFKLCEAYQPKN